MIVPALLRLRLALAVLVLTSGLIGMSGCGGGWGDLKPTIAAQLNQAQTVAAGQTATFKVAATGTGPFTYQWYKNGVAIPGATSSTFSTPVNGNDNGAIYTAAVINAGGTVMSSPYVLTVNTPPTIATQPASQTVVAGQSATFSVSATGPRRLPTSGTRMESPSRAQPPAPTQLRRRSFQTPARSCRSWSQTS